MSDIIFNVADKQPYDCLYYDSTYGYRACLNGRPIDIANIETVCALKDKFGLEELNIKGSDVSRFEKCLYGDDYKRS